MTIACEDESAALWRHNDRAWHSPIGTVFIGASPGRFVTRFTSDRADDTYVTAKSVN